MKLSEMNGNDYSAALCELCLLFDELTNSEDVKKCFLQDASIPGKTRIDMLHLIPALLQGDAKQKTFRMISILTGKTKQEIEEQPGAQTFALLRESLNAEVLSFFK